MKVNELVNRVREAYIDCVESVHNQELYEDSDKVHFSENLTPEETKELILDVQKILHYYNWADLPTIMQEAKTASAIMIYVDDVSSWWRFEA